MGFERFVSTRYSRTPLVTLGKTGYIMFNKATADTYGLYEYPFAVRYYDPAERRIAVQFTKRQAELGAVKVRRPCIDVPAKGFLERWKIPHIGKHGSAGLVVVQLTPNDGDDGPTLAIQLPPEVHDHDRPPA